MEFNMLSVVQLVGGLALFIYGMTTMGKGLERAAGSKLEKTLEKMTGNVFKALLMGLVVTMVIQSSRRRRSWWSVCQRRYHDAQAVCWRNPGCEYRHHGHRADPAPGQRHRSGNLLMDLLKPSNLAYLVVLAGVIIMMLAKKRRARAILRIFSPALVFCSSACR